MSDAAARAAALREAARLKFQQERAAKELAATKALLVQDERDEARGATTASRLHQLEELRRRVNVASDLSKAADKSDALLGQGGAVTSAIEAGLSGSDLQAVAIERYTAAGNAAAPPGKLHRAESGAPRPTADFVIDKLRSMSDRGPTGTRETHFISTQGDAQTSVASPGSGEKSAGEARAERAEVSHARRLFIETQRANLPVTKAKQEILAAVAANQVIVIIGETGSGKTTQIPQFLLEAGYSKVACTQPRRLAAMSVAERVATEMNVRCGQLVGYKVRFDDKTSQRTEIEFATDGMMIKTIVSDPQLSQYKAIMIDEAHERSIATDLLLGILRDLLRRRKDLKVIVASATIEAAKFVNFFGDVRAPLVKVSGRTYPVQTFYIPEPVEDYVLQAAKCALQTHLDEPLPGDILVFMPGQDDIEKCIDKLQEAIQGMPSGSVRPVLLLPLYSTLPAEEQKLIYAPTPPNTRKIIVSTNIAETSITVDGVAYVIDTGLCKEKYYDTTSNMECLSLVPISKASAEQRKGRAGRTRAGSCFRLYTKHMFSNELTDEPVPEILRSSLTAILLNLKHIGISNPLAFDFIDAPSPDSMMKAFSQLRALGALTDRGELSKLGRQMAELPVDPPLAKVLLAGQTKWGCCKQACIAVAMLSLQNGIFLNNKEKEKLIEGVKKTYFAHTTGDATGYVAVFREWEEGQGYHKQWCDSNALNFNALQRAKDVRDQLLNSMHKLAPEGVSSCVDELQLPELLTKSLLAGCFLNIAKLQLDDKTYLVPRTKVEAAIFPGSCLAPLMRTVTKMPGVPTAASQAEPPKFTNVVPGQRPQLVMFNELRQLRERAYMVHVSVILPQWVHDVVPNFYKDKDLCNDIPSSSGSRSGGGAAGPLRKDALVS